MPAQFYTVPENKMNLERFFQAIDRGDLTLVWEPRGDWRPGEIGRTCRDLEPVHGVDPFKVEPLHGEMRYFRLHGRTGYSYRFTDEDLQSLRAWSEGPTYCMFNNISMFEDAKRFKVMISTGGVS